MAPKRKEVGTSSTCDIERFKTPEAEALYNKTLFKADFIRERAVEQGQHSLMETKKWFGDVFKKRGWMKLSKLVTEEGCSDLVREFYANAVEPESDTRVEPTFKSYCRGATVDYSPNVIRKLLDLSSDERVNEVFGGNGPDYHTLLKEFPADLLLSAMTGRPEADWERGTGRDRAIKHIPRIVVAPEVRVWSFYTTDSILPTSNKSEVRPEIVTLIYCIMNDLPIDLPRIISRRIHEVAQVKREERTLVFPLLLTKLLHKKLG